jgi:hypothetical protein
VTVTAPPRPNDPIEFQKLKPEGDAEALIKEARQRARRRRQMHGAIAALVALAGVAVTVFGRTGQSHPTAATHPSSAGPSAASPSRRRSTTQGNVRIELTGTMPPARGEFTVFGAIADRGTFVDTAGLTFVRTLRGRNGIIRIRVGPRGRWEIIEGTTAYAFLHGRGREAGLYSNPIGITMSGTVSGEPLEPRAG